MRTVEQMRNVARDLIASYDARVDAIGTVIDNTYQVLDDFKDKRAKLSTQLKETLAKRGSLRKKDFDRMINGILLNQEEKEKEVKQSLKHFLREQKKEAFELKDALTNNEVERMKKAQVGIEKGIAEAKELLKGFYEQQQLLTEKLRELLTKKKDLKIKDFKHMIRNLSQDANFAQTLTRGKEVKRMGLSNVATDIKALGQDMAASHADRAVSNAERVASVEALSEEIREMTETFQKEHAERKAELNEMLENSMESLHKGVRQFIKDLHSENAQRQREVNGLLEDIQKEMEGFRKENKLRHNEVGRLVAAVKEMWSTVAGAKRGAKTVSAHSFAQTEERKPVRRGKKKPKKVQSL